MLIDYQLSQTSIILRVKIRNSSVSTGAGLAGLTNASAGLRIAAIADNEVATTVYTQAAGHIQTIATLGTFAAPSALNCRFAEVDPTNHPGVYEVQLADARFAVASAKSLLVSLSGAPNMAECDVVIPLRSTNPYNGVHGGMNALPNAAANAAGGLPVSIAGALDLDEQNADIEAIQTGVAAIPTTPFLAASAPANFGALLISGAGHISNVDTLTTYTGNTPQTGDSYARLGAPAGASIAADLVEIDALADSILAGAYAGGDTAGTTTLLGRIPGTVQPQTGDSYARLGAPAGASIAADLAEIEAETDALGGAVTVGGYSAGQDPATLVLDVSAAAHNTAGTIGAKVNAAGGASDPLGNPVPGTYAQGSAGAALGRVGSGQIVTTSPVTAGGAVLLVRGADYNHADGQALVWTDPASAWPALVQGTIITFAVNRGQVMVAGSVVTAGPPNGQVMAEPTAAQTLTLAAGLVPYELLATLPSGRTVVLVLPVNVVTVLERQTA
jgi:hypothetical protein